MADRPALHPNPGPYAEDCPVREILDRVGDKWSVLVVVNLGDGQLRFNELHRRCGGISQRMLTKTVRQLERDGLVWRKATPTVPLTVEYGLTQRGETLLGPLQVLAAWSVANGPAIAKERAAFDLRQERLRGVDDGA
jgi:DNA-binding HxlR family transcriptional regulator